MRKNSEIYPLGRLILLLLAAFLGGDLMAQPTAPSIVVSPTNRTIVAGTNVALGVTVTGSPPFSYQWRRANTPLREGGRISGSTTATLLLTNVQYEDAGSYAVVVTNAVGAVTSTPPAVLIVVDTTPPTVLATTPAKGATNIAMYNPIQVTFSEAMAPDTINGTTFTLRIGANAQIFGAVTYDPVTRTAKLTPSTLLSSRTTYTARISTGVTDLAGNNLAQDLTWTFTTSGLYEPEFGGVILGSSDDGSSARIILPFTVSIFSRSFTNMWVNNNGNVTFTGTNAEFTAFAFPNASNVVIVAPFFADVDTRGVGSGYVHYTNFENRVVITWDHVGYYNRNVDKRNTFQLIITAPQGGTNLFGFSYDDIQWTTGGFSDGINGFGGSPARAGFDSGDGTNAVKFWEGNSPQSVTNNTDTASCYHSDLCLTNITHTSAWFSSSGPIPANKPPVANAGSDLVVEQLTPAGTAVTLNGAASTDDGLLRALSYDWTEGAVALGNGAVINPILPWGSHAVTLSVSDGQYQSSASIKVTVRDTTPPDTFISGGPLEGQKISLRATTLSWSGTDNGTVANSLLFSYSLDGGAASPFVATPSNTFLGLIDGAHTVSVTAQDLRGNVDDSPAVRRFSVDATPPTNFTIGTAAQLTQCAITWTTDEPSTSQVEYGVTANYGAVSPLAGGVVINHVVTLTGLIPGTAYHFRVRSRDALGNEGFSPDGTFATLPDITPPETVISSGPAEESTICTLPTAVTWSGTDDVTLPGSLAFSYQIDSQPYTAFSSATTVSLSGLAEGSHTFRVRARDLAGNEDPSPAPLRFTVDTHGPIFSLINANPAAGQAVVTWKTDEPSNSHVDYGISASYGSSTALNSQLVTNHSATISGLLPNTTYHYRVHSRDACGHEAVSSDGTFNTLPAPDLRVVSVDVPPEAWTGGAFDVGWVLTNSGPAAATGPWVDTLYLSGDNRVGNDTLLGTFEYVESLKPGESLARVQSVIINRSLVTNGTYFIIVQTDSKGSVFEGLGETNNSLISTSMVVRLTPLPDLVVDSIQAPTNGIGGQVVDVNWFICNDGSGDSDAPFWYDHVYLSTTTNRADAIRDYGQYPNPAYLASGDCYFQSARVELPVGAGGLHYFIIETDANGQLLEENEANNRSRSVVPIFIQLVRPGFLHVESVQTAPAPPTAVFAGEQVTVTWTVRNSGESTITSGSYGGWDDAVALSPTPGYDYVHGYWDVAHHIWFYGSLAPGASYVHSATFTVPLGIAAGRWYPVPIVDTHFLAGGPGGIGSGNIGRDQNSAPIDVILPPPSDLEMAAVIAPTSAFSGQTMSVQWTVGNNGNNRTSGSYWYDAVYLSPTLAFNLGQSLLVDTVGHYGTLDLEAAYTQSASITIPSDFVPTNAVAVTNYLYVVTDAGNSISEITKTNNVLRSPRPVVITRIPPQPPADLAVVAVAAPGTVVAGRQIDIAWSVENRGAGATSVNSWVDKIYLSQDPILSAGTDWLIGIARHDGSLGAGASYIQTQTFSLPYCAIGSYYVIVVADSGAQVNENGALANNVRVTDKTVRAIASKAARLNVSSVNPPATAVAGAAVTVSWTVSDLGHATTNASWTDALYLSSSGQFNPENAFLLGLYPHSGNLADGESYTQTGSGFIPQCFSGAYFVYVVVDIDNVVNGLSCETNNWKGSDAPLTISPRAYASLEASGISTPTSVNDAGLWTVQWTVTNAGPSAATGSWIDAIYASVSSVLDTNAIFLGQFTHSGGLASGKTYSDSRSVAFPACKAGEYYIFAVADVGNEVNVEACLINNIIRTGTPIVVNSGLYPDLRPSNLGYPATANAAQTMVVSWSVTNIGLAAASAPWTDALYLSPTRNFDRDHSLFLGTYAHNTPLAAGASYSESKSVLLPDDAHGTFYFVVVTDSGNAVDECSGDNNNNIVAGTALDIPVTIYPDLNVPVVSAPGAAFSGQSVLVSWVVSNDGTGQTHDVLWYDAVYLSKDQLFDPGTDVRLGVFLRPTTLGVGGAYTNSATVGLPPNASGPYYFLVVADTTSALFEHIFDENNIGRTPVATFIALPAPSDLTVSNVTITPAFALPDDQVTVTWTTRNNSANNAVGAWTDVLYLSTNTVWDINAIQIARHDHGGLASNASYVDVWTGPLPALTPGSYHAVVRTDVRNVARESNETNNTAASVNSIAVDIPVLILGNARTNQLRTGVSQYYKVKVPAGETLRITLNSASALSANELYVRFGAVPDLAQYEFIFNNILEPNQQIDVPTTQAGWYFILVRGANVPDGPAPSAVKAELVPLAVSRVTPDHAGDNGQVTLTLRGARFQPGGGVKLTSAGKTYNASAVTFVDATTVKARFNFNQAIHGAYDVTVTNPDASSATAPGGVTIESATPLQARTVNGAVNLLPRVGLPFRWNGYALNVGNVDIPYLTVSVVVDSAAPIALTPPAAAVPAQAPSAFIVRDLPPGEFLDFSFVLNDLNSSFRYEVVPRSQSKEDYFAEISDMAEAQRDVLLTSTSFAQLPASFTSYLRDSQTWREFFGLRMAIAGLIETNEISLLPAARVATLAELAARVLAEKDEAQCIQRCNEDYAIKYKNIGIGWAACMVAAAASCALDGPACLLAAAACDAGEVIALKQAAEELGVCVKRCSEDNPPPCGTPTGGAKGPAAVTKVSAKDAKPPDDSGCGGQGCHPPPKDPNAKDGPAGYGEPAFVGAQAPWLYTVYFENVTNAAAYARQVYVSDTLDPNLDIRTFRLREISFGSVTISVPTNRSFYQTRVALPPPHPINVVADISAGVDLQGNRVFWTINAIDVNTGELVASAQEGILPPNDANHSGEGHVVYTIKPKAGAATGTIVTNKAVIVFDTNDPIETNPTRHTVDGAPPASAVAALPPAVSQATFDVSWSGSDDAGGSGLRTFDVYVSDNGGPWQLWLGAVTQTTATYEGESAHRYAFYSIGRDNSGNVEPAPASADAFTLVSNNRPPALAPIADQNVNVNATLVITNVVVDSDVPAQNLTFTLDDAPFGFRINPTTGLALWRPRFSQAGTTNLVTIKVTDNGLPPRSQSRSFLAVVGDYAESSFGSVVTLAGEPDCLPLSLVSSVGLTNISFILNIPPDRLTNLFVSASEPQLMNPSFVPIDAARARVTLATLPGFALIGTQEVAEVCFNTVPGQLSGIVELAITDVTARRADGTRTSNVVATAGRVVVVGDRPVLQVTGTNQNRLLLDLHAQPGTAFDLQTSATLSGPWSNALRLNITNKSESVFWTNRSERTRFFRLGHQ